MATATGVASAVKRLPVFLFAHLTHHLCTGMLIPLLPFIRDAFNLDYFQSGLLVSSFSLVYGLSNLPMGTISDRMSKRLLIPLGLLGVAIPTAAIGLSSEFWQLILFLIVMGSFGGTYHAPAAALLSQLFPIDWRGKALGLHLIGGSSSLFITPVLAGLIAMTFDWRMAYIILAIPASLGAFLFWTFIRDEARTAALAAGVSKLKVSISWIEVARLVGAVVAIAIISQLVSAGVNSFLPIYLVDKHSVPKEYAAMIVGIVYGAGMVSGPLGGGLSDRFGRIPVILVSVILTGPLVYLLTILSFGPALIASLVLFGLAMTAKMPVIESLIVDNVPMERRATVLGMYYFLTQEVGGISTPVVGFMIDTYGLNASFTGLAILACLSSVLIFLVRGKVSAQQRA